jgi:hypothetical protein
MNWCTSLFNVIHIFSNSITIWQNWFVYKLCYLPVQTLEYIICKYYGIDNPEQLIRNEGYL